MARHLHNDCVGCDWCRIGCGRNYNYYVYTCDDCGSTSEEEDFLTEVNGKEICPDCLDAVENEAV